MLKSVFGTTILMSSYPCYKLFNNNKKINLVLDMDETLLYTCKKDKHEQINKSNIHGKPIESENYMIYPRPYLHLWLDYTSKIANLYLITRGKKEYAERVLKDLQIDNYFIEKKYREDISTDCKDLKILFGSRDISNSILIDDLKSNQCKNQNFYHIPKYNMFVKNDYELIKLFLYILYKS
jgi:TFIIF-interacting CTD phosphatase-like protein